MRKLNAEYKLGKDYRELFTVSVSTLKGIVTDVGITNDGLLLYIIGTEFNIGSGYWVQEEFYEISKAELRDYLNKARMNGRIDEAIMQGRTSEEELEKLSK